MPPKPSHGGKRPGAGRPPRTGGPARNFTVRLSEAEEAELVAALRDGETISDLLRTGGLGEARRRRNT
jgi:hypothetical protein